MQRVVLIGDSIRMSYEPSVRSALADVAFVWAPGENCQHSTHILMNFWPWVAMQQPDVLHINSGHWDCRRIIPGREDTIVPLDVYQANVRRILTLAKEFTRKQVVWATTTPLNEALLMRAHLRKGLTGRTQATIDRYNEAAAEVACSLNVPINDLGGFVASNGGTIMLSADGVHFDEANADKLGEEVARQIRRYL
jgi:lysophospholipase L1-like esterase